MKFIGEPAVFDGPDHRLWLERKMSNGSPRPMIIVGHNPSVAGYEKLDPTARKCFGFANRLGYGVTVMVNMVSRVATKATDITADMVLNSDHADDAIEAAFSYAKDNDGLVLFCPGAPKGVAAVKRKIVARYEDVFRLAERMGVPLKALRISDKGWPEHPLYLPYECTPVQIEMAPK